MRFTYYSNIYRQDNTFVYSEDPGYLTACPEDHQAFGARAITSENITPTNMCELFQFIQLHHTSCLAFHGVKFADKAIFKLFEKLSNTITYLRLLRFDSVDLSLAEINEIGKVIQNARGIYIIEFSNVNLNDEMMAVLNAAFAARATDNQELVVRFENYEKRGKYARKATEICPDEDVLFLVIEKKARIHRLELALKKETSQHKNSLLTHAFETFNKNCTCRAAAALALTVVATAYVCRP